MAELVTRIENLFSDSETAPSVVCSTVHKAKGLEARRVYVLDDTLFKMGPCECSHWHKGVCGECACQQFAGDPKRVREEQNIAYVAITRAQNILVRVAGMP